VKVAIVHDYLNQMGGAERVVLQFMELFPEAPIFTSLFEPDRVDPRFSRADVRTSFIQRIPFVRNHFRRYLPLYPLAFEQFDLRGFDLVLSCTTAWTKGVLTDPETCHVCYVNTPMRFAWRPFDYLEVGDVPLVLRPLFHLVMHHLRTWDLSCEARVDEFIANSANVAHRIAKFYRRDSAIIHPPVATARFEMAAGPGEGYVVVSRLKSYKRIDTVIEAVNRRRARLTIIGDGSDRGRLEKLAGPTVRFAGRVSDAEVARTIREARALILATEEDFGIAPLEANACGRPVIAYSRGGALETVVPANGYPPWLAVTGEAPGRQPTGVFFHEQTADALHAALQALESTAFDPRALRTHAESFDDAVFRRNVARFIEESWVRHCERFRTLRLDERR
jgi:glycosyltransferase involved in cell wall biosynthesis